MNIDQYAKQARVQMMALERFPGIVSITDYTWVLNYKKENGVWPDNPNGKLIWMNEELLKSESLPDEGYYNKLKTEVLTEGNRYCEEDLAVLESDKPLTFYNDTRYGREWVKFKYTYEDGDRTYLAATLINVDACRVTNFRENVSGDGRSSVAARSAAG